MSIADAKASALLKGVIHTALKTLIYKRTWLFS